MFEKFRPLGSRVLIKRVEYQENTENSLIIVPDTAKEKAQTGQVISVGAGSLDKSGNVVPVSVKVGDIVYVGKYAGTDMGAQDYVIVHADDILGVVEKN